MLKAQAWPVLISPWHFNVLSDYKAAYFRLQIDFSVHGAESENLPINNAKNCGPDKKNFKIFSKFSHNSSNILSRKTECFMWKWIFLDTHQCPHVGSTLFFSFSTHGYTVPVSVEYIGDPIFRVRDAPIPKIASGIPRYAADVVRMEFLVFTSSQISKK